MEKTIIILTKSKKHSGYCVAGIDFETGEWIRLVSSIEDIEGAVPRADMILSNGEEVEIYDIINCQLIKYCGTKVQPENWLYDENVAWEKIGTSNFEEVVDIHGYDTPDYIFGNEDTSLPENWDFDGNASLCLVNIRNAAVWVKTFEKQSVSLNFVYNNKQYNYMRISQIDLLDYYRNKPDALYALGNISVIFSLTDKYYRNGKCYKVVAQILE